MAVKWNLTRSLKPMKNCDVLILSIGKSGRTWLRVMLNKYLSLAYGVSFGLEDLSALNRSIPSIMYSHELWVHLSKATPRQRLMGKFVVPPDVLARKKVVVMYRDPRDVIVSLYFQGLKRSRRKNTPVMPRELMETVKDRRAGIGVIVQVMNTWRARLATHPDCFWISYEDLQADPLGEFMSLIAFLEPDVIDRQAAAQAVEFARFQNMKKMEAAGEFGSRILQPGDADDPDSYKVREGKVGGYTKHFSAEEIAYLDGIIGELDPFYPYR